ncbi:hypothetical protein Tco_1352961 [Tanacetum coccineum]
MKLMHFLMGLNDAYIKIRSNILSREPLPDVRNAYAIISSEESHKVVSDSGTSQKSQSSVFIANVPNRGNFQRSHTSANASRPSNVTRSSDSGNMRPNGGSTLVCEDCGFNAINGFDMPLPVAVCSGLVNPLAPRKASLVVHHLLLHHLCLLSSSLLESLYEVFHKSFQAIFSGFQNLLEQKSHLVILVVKLSVDFFKAQSSYS